MIEGQLDADRNSAIPPVVAAFDFDGTLTRGGSVFAFLVDVRGLFPVLAATFWALPLVVKGALVGGPAADRAKEALFIRLLAGLSAEHLEQKGASFAARHLRHRERKAVTERLAWHREQGHYVIVVSASPECYVRAAAALLGADDAVATRLAEGGGGILTGRYEGKNCRGPEKYSRVASWMRTHGLNGKPGQPVLWAYGNSRGDHRLLEAADYGINAGHLGRFGALRRFRRLAQTTDLQTEQDRLPEETHS